MLMYSFYKCVFKCLYVYSRTVLYSRLYVRILMSICMDTRVYKFL